MLLRTVEGIVEYSQLLSGIAKAESWISAVVYGISYPLLIENITCQKALRLAIRKSWPKVIVEGDSTITINACRGASSPIIISNQVVDSLELAKCCPSVCFSFIRREVNQEAHVLGRSSLAIFLLDCIFILK